MSNTWSNLTAPSPHRLVSWPPPHAHTVPVTPTCCVHCGTGAMAPPGAENATPRCPSAVGPLLLQLYCRPSAGASSTL